MQTFSYFLLSEKARFFCKLIEIEVRLDNVAVDGIPPRAALKFAHIAEMVWLKQYHVVGRMVPGKGGSAEDEETSIYRMRIFAPNEVMAKSRFWYFLKKLKRVKKANGEILAVNVINEKDCTVVKNYGIWLRYRSRSNFANMYKEYRDVTTTGAVEQMYHEMGGLHRARWSSIQVIKVQEIKEEDVRRKNTLQFLGPDLKFPLPHRAPRRGKKSTRSTFVARRPTTITK